MSEEEVEEFVRDIEGVMGEIERFVLLHEQTGELEQEIMNNSHGLEQEQKETILQAMSGLYKKRMDVERAALHELHQLKKQIGI